MSMKFLDKSAKIELTDVFNVSLTLGDGTEYDEVELRRLFPFQTEIITSPLSTKKKKR